MSEIRKVGAVAGAVAAVLVLAGCGGSGSDSGSTAGSSVSAAASPAVEEPFDTALPTMDTGPVYADGPEGDIDRKADEEGWVVDELYASASEYVRDICDSLPESAKDSSSRPQWLAESGYMTEDSAKVLKFGVSKLCPKWLATVEEAASGDYERWISGGDWEVVADPAPYDPESESDVQQIGPGTYRAVGEFSDCYWERTSQSGDILDNQFVTQARQLTVTLQVGNLFRNDCGVFKPVG